MKTNTITLEFVNENFYNIDEVIYRKDGKKCSNLFNQGYYKIFFNYKHYLVHRILWILYNQKTIPENSYIDHFDGNPSNNSMENLRLATSSQNCHNSKIRKDNTSGIKGLVVSKNNGYYYYYCQIRKNYKIYNKRFPYTPSGLELAKNWLEETRKELHGDFSRND